MVTCTVGSGGDAKASAVVGAVAGTGTEDCTDAAIGWATGGVMGVGTMEVVGADDWRTVSRTRSIVRSTRRVVADASSGVKRSGAGARVAITGLAEAAGIAAVAAGMVDE